MKKFSLISLGRGWEVGGFCDKRLPKFFLRPPNFPTPSFPRAGAGARRGAQRTEGPRGAARTTGAQQRGALWRAAALPLRAARERA